LFLNTTKWLSISGPDKLAHAKSIDKRLENSQQSFSNLSGFQHPRMVFFARPVYNEQLYSMIVWSKLALIPLGQKTIGKSTFYDTYLFRINFFFLLKMQFVA
jgi:hypothetical protein